MALRENKRRKKAGEGSLSARFIAQIDDPPTAWGPRAPLLGAEYHRERAADFTVYDARSRGRHLQPDYTNARS